MPRSPLVAVLTLIAASFVSHSTRAAEPTLTATILIEKKSSFQQISASEATEYKPSIDLTIEFSPSAAFDVFSVDARGSGVTWSLPRTTPESAASFSASRSYDTVAAASAALPTGFYSVTVDTTSLLPGLRVRGSVDFNVTADFPSTSPKFANFAALQSWDGSPLTLSWSGLPSADSIAQLQLDILRADGSVAYTSFTEDGKNALSETATSSPPITLSSSPGETLTAVLTYTRPIGRPSTAGGNVIANNQLGEVRIPIRRAGFPVPTITAHPNSATASTGSSQSLTVAATGESLAYAWKKNGAIISGATSSTFILTNISASDAGSYTVTVTNSGGSVTSNAATLTVLAPNLPPTVTTSPAALTVVAGAKSTLSVTAAGTAPFTYQWLRNGTAIPGATSTTLTLDSTLVSDAGAYSVRITNSVSTITSAAATLSVTPISRISNLSVLTSLSDPTDNFTLGYVIGGANTTGAKPLVLRAAGPALAALGVGGTVEDPKLELFAGPTKTGENDNWAGASTLTSAFTAVGAFPFASPTSRDAAVATALTTRDNSVKISSANASTGLVIAEIYDATANDFFISATPRLLNVSVLKSLGTGLTVGFTIAGSTPKTVLIRAIGPTLGDFGVPGTVADPQLILFNSSSVKLAENDNWAATPALGTSLAAAFSTVGAFALPTTSRDAVLLTTLPPGGYSVQVSGVANTTGAALVEVYEVP